MIHKGSAMSRKGWAMSHLGSAMSHKGSAMSHTDSATYVRTYALTIVHAHAAPKSLSFRVRVWLKGTNLLRLWVSDANDV